LLGYRQFSSSSVGINTYNGVVRFSFGDLPECRDEFSSQSEEGNREITTKKKKKKKSRKAKLNELRFYRLKAKKKMKSPNPEVRIRYKLEKVGAFLEV